MEQLQTQFAEFATRLDALASNNTFLVIFIFVIAALLGLELITKVPPTLHTPLMSGSNAISGITIVGALMCALALSDKPVALPDGNAAITGWFANILAFLAIVFATINVVGGYMVTDRMLGSFKKKGKK
jgi:NAD(P) transhydrogenase subunit alpha